MTEIVKFKKLSEDAQKPTKATDGSCGYDIYLSEDVMVKRGRSILPTGIAIEMPRTLEAQVRPRSGFSAKGMEDELQDRHDADVILGTIDSDYRNAIGVIVINRGEAFKMRKGTRIAQLVFSFVPDVAIVETDVLSDTERGMGGFGHTGSN